MLILNFTHPLTDEHKAQIETLPETTLGGKKAPFLHLGKQLFWLEDVQLMPDTSASWTGFTSLSTDRTSSAEAFCSPGYAHA